MSRYGTPDVGLRGSRGTTRGRPRAEEGSAYLIALLTLPAAIAGHYVHSLGRLTLVATLLGGLLTSTGLALSYGPDLPAGPTIILLAGAIYVISAVVSRALAGRRARRAAGP